MKYAYQQHSDGQISFTAGEHIAFWKEISKEDYEKFYCAQTALHQVKLDEAGNLQIIEKKDTNIE